MQRYEGAKALPSNHWNAGTKQNVSPILLDRHLQRICLHSLERSINVQQCWQLQQELLKDYSHFNDWMHSAEAMARDPRTSQTCYSEAKVELNRFELLRKQMIDMMISLESINWRYRRLAREPGVEVAQELKEMLHNGNQRWDILQRRVGSICKRLKDGTCVKCSHGLFIISNVTVELLEPVTCRLEIAWVLPYSAESKGILGDGGSVSELDGRRAMGRSELTFNSISTVRCLPTKTTREIETSRRTCKYLVSQREEFESQQGLLWQQSMDLDIRLTHLEYFSTEGAAEKIKRLQGLQRKITSLTAKTDELLLMAETLLQKSESPDAVAIEAEVWDLLQFQQELFTRIAQFHKRLLCIDLEFDYLPDKGSCEADYPCDMKLEGWHVRSTSTHKEDVNDVDSGRSSPSSLDSLPLEWDPSVDIGEVVDSRHSVLPDTLTSLVGKRRRKSQKNWRWVKIDSSTPQRVAVGHQDASEIISVLAEQGPCSVQTQRHGSGHRQGAIDLGRRTTKTRRMRKVKRHCQEGQSLSCKPSSGQKSQDQSDPRQDPGLGLCSRPGVKDVECRPMETEQKQDQRRISLPGGISRGGSKLLLQSGASEKKSGSRSCFLPLYNLLIIVVLFLLLAVMAAFFLLLCVMQEFNWHHKSNFLPFHLTLTYVNGLPSM